MSHEVELVLQFGRGSIHSDEIKEICIIMLTTVPNFRLRMVLFLRKGNFFFFGE